MDADLTTLAASWALTYLLHSTLLLGGVWLLSRRVLRSHAIRDLAWKSALLGGLVTATVQTGLGLRPVGGALPLPTPRVAVAAPASGQNSAPLWNGELIASRSDAPTGGQPTMPAESPTPARSVPPAASPEAIGPTPDTEPVRLPSTVAMALGLWGLIAAVLCLGYLVRRTRAMRRIGRRRPITDSRLLRVLGGLRTTGGVRRPIRLTAAPGLTSPIALGWSEIVLPEAALRDLDPDQQESMLAHELAHLARRDPSWLTLACLIERALFIQPLNRLARLRMQESAEYLCDDWAVNRTGSGFSLATCLLKVAEWVDATPRPIPLAGMAEHRSQLVARVHRLIEGRPMSAAPRSLWLLAGSVSLIGLTAVAAPRVAPEAAPPTPAAAAAPAGDSLAVSLPDGVALMVAPADTDTTVTPAPEASRAALSRDLRRAELRAENRARRDARRAMDQAMRGVRAPRALARPVVPMAPPAPAPPVAPFALFSQQRSLSRLAERLDRMRSRRPQDTTSIAVPALIGALKDRDVEVRRASARSLSNLGDPRAVPGLIEALTDKDMEVRALAAGALGNLEDTRAVPGLTAALKDSSKEVRYTALAALANLPGSVPPDAILSALGDKDEDVRHAALSLAVNQIDRGDEHAAVDSRYVAIFVRMLSDPSPDIRGEAASALGESRLREAPAGLLSAASDKDADVRQQVAYAFGEIRDPKSVPALKGLLQDSSADVREAAVQALAEIRDQSALEALVGAIKSPDATVRRAAAEALGQRGDD